MVEAREVGRKKLNQATRYLTLVLAFVQSMTLTAGFNYYTQLGFVNNPNISTFVVIGLILTAGTMLVTWLENKSQNAELEMVCQ